MVRGSAKKFVKEESGRVQAQLPGFTPPPGMPPGMEDPAIGRPPRGAVRPAGFHATRPLFAAQPPIPLRSVAHCARTNPAALGLCPVGSPSPEPTLHPHPPPCGARNGTQGAPRARSNVGCGVWRGALAFHCAVRARWRTRSRTAFDLHLRGGLRHVSPPPWKCGSDGRMDSIADALGAPRGTPLLRLSTCQPSMGFDSIGSVLSMLLEV